MDSPRVLVVILNYLTYQMTLDFIKKFREIVSYDNYDIFVIDNDSPNESKIVLESNSFSQKYRFFANEINSGYAAGNNIGLRFAYQNNYKYALVANNDLKLVDPLFLRKMVDHLENDETAGWCGPSIKDLNGKQVNPYVSRPSFFKMTLGLFGRKKEKMEQSGYVYRLHGCCLLLRCDCLNEIGYFDERTFLYFEENILAERFLLINKRAYYCNEASIVHLESLTVKKTVKKHSLKKTKIILRSMDIYLKYYLHYGWLKRCICKAIRGLLVYIRG